MYQFFYSDSFYSVRQASELLVLNFGVLITNNSHF